MTYKHLRRKNLGGAGRLLPSQPARLKLTCLNTQVAPAGRSYKASFKVGHGCGVSPTRQISVAILAGAARGPCPSPAGRWRCSFTLGLALHQLAAAPSPKTWCASPGRPGRRTTICPTRTTTTGKQAGAAARQGWRHVLPRDPGLCGGPQRVDRNPPTRPEAVGFRARPHCWTSWRRWRVRPQSLNPRKETP